MVTVQSGAIANDLDGLAGRTVCDVRTNLANIFNIAADAVATLNGRRADSDTVLEDGDVLSFGRPLAQKGI